MLLSDLDLDRTYTYADYYGWDFEERVELIDGKVFPMNMLSDRIHQEVLGDIFIALHNFLDDTSCQTYFAPFDVRFPEKSIEDKDITTVLQPDILVVCDPSKLDYRGCIGVPDIVVEVLKPRSNVIEMKNKYAVYEHAGAKEYWVVSPQNQMFFVHVLKDGKFQLLPIMVSGDIVTSSVLPGFSLDLTKLFKNVDSGQI